MMTPLRRIRRPFHHRLQPHSRYFGSHHQQPTQRVSKSKSDSRRSVRIGHVQVPLFSDPKSSDASRTSMMIPSGYLPEKEAPPSRTMLQHLQWIMAKDPIGQDAMLIGPPGAGSIYRRRLALAYAELTQRPVELLTLSSDTTESDLKQRRELVSSSSNSSSSSTSSASGTSVEFVAQAPVRAALEGRLLILDGLEKVERNVVCMYHTVSPYIHPLNFSLTHLFLLTSTTHLFLLTFTSIASHFK